MKIVISKFGDKIDSRIDKKSLTFSFSPVTPEKTFDFISLIIRSVYVYSWT